MRSYLVIVHQREYIKDQRAPGTLSSQEPQTRGWGGHSTPGGEDARVEGRKRLRNVLRCKLGQPTYNPEKQVEVKWNLDPSQERGLIVQVPNWMCPSP